jgi:hypothetical protein
MSVAWSTTYTSTAQAPSLQLYARVRSRPYLLNDAVWGAKPTPIRFSAAQAGIGMVFATHSRDTVAPYAVELFATQALPSAPATPYAFTLELWHASPAGLGDVSNPLALLPVARVALARPLTLHVSLPIAPPGAAAMNASYHRALPRDLRALGATNTGAAWVTANASAILAPAPGGPGTEQVWPPLLPRSYYALVVSVNDTSGGPALLPSAAADRTLYKSTDAPAADAFDFLGRTVASSGSLSGSGTQTWSLPALLNATHVPAVALEGGPVLRSIVAPTLSSRIALADNTTARLGTRGAAAWVFAVDHAATGVNHVTVALQASAAGTYNLSCALWIVDADTKRPYAAIVGARAINASLTVDAAAVGTPRLLAFAPSSLAPWSGLSSGLFALVITCLDGCSDATPLVWLQAPMPLRDELGALTPSDASYPALLLGWTIATGNAASSIASPASWSPLQNAWVGAGAIFLEAAPPELTTTFVDNTAGGGFWNTSQAPLAWNTNDTVASAVIFAAGTESDAPMQLHTINLAIRPLIATGTATVAFQISLWRVKAGGNPLQDLVLLPNSLTSLSLTLFPVGSSPPGLNDTERAVRTVTFLTMQRWPALKPGALYAIAIVANISGGNITSNVGWAPGASPSATGGRFKLLGHARQNSRGVWSRTPDAAFCGGIKIKGTDLMFTPDFTSAGFLDEQVQTLGGAMGNTVYRSRVIVSDLHASLYPSNITVFLAINAVKDYTFSLQLLTVGVDGRPTLSAIKGTTTLTTGFSMASNAILLSSGVGFVPRYVRGSFLLAATRAQHEVRSECHSFGHSDHCNHRRHVAL